MLAGTCTTRHYEYEHATGRLAFAAFDDGCDATALGGFEEHYEYGYDVNGNRVCADTPNGDVCNRDGQADEVVIDGQDRLERHGDVTYTYDAAGTLESRRDGVFLECFDYNVFGTLLGWDRVMSFDGGTSCDAMGAIPVARVRYDNDPLGRRIARHAEVMTSTSGLTEPVRSVNRWVYQDQLNPIAELNENWSVRVRYVYATHPFSPDAMIEYHPDGSQPTWHHMVRDPRGSVRGWITLERSGDGVAADVVRTTHEHAAYDPWGLRSDGAPATMASSPAAELTSLGFAGGIYDPLTGLVRFGARDYDPRIGRWTAKDPIGFAGGDTLLYGYVGGDPVNGVDPTGLIDFAWWDYEFGRPGRHIERLLAESRDLLGPDSADADVVCHAARRALEERNSLYTYCEEDGFFGINPDPDNRIALEVAAAEHYLYARCEATDGGLIGNLFDAGSGFVFANHIYEATKVLALDLREYLPIMGPGTTPASIRNWAYGEAGYADGVADMLPFVPPLYSVPP